jgi:Alw26I/Eco31I/Esp3I family type II restriction m6 adenine DNA methyltransferase
MDYSWEVTAETPRNGDPVRLDSHHRTSDRRFYRSARHNLWFTNASGYQLKHVSALRVAGYSGEAAARLMLKATGRYYTHETVGRHLARAIVRQLDRVVPDGKITAVDPFCGDGRLVSWLLDEYLKSGRGPVRWEVTLWDIDGTGLQSAIARMQQLAIENPELELSVDVHECDSFLRTLTTSERFDIVVTNPPWDLLKPDRRETQHLNVADRVEYTSSMRTYDETLTRSFPHSRPSRRFAGWGTQLSRVGLEASIKLLRVGGVLGIVVPAPILADDVSVLLRHHLFTKTTVTDVAYYPAEARLFESADVSAATIVALGRRTLVHALSLSRFSEDALSFTTQAFTADVVDMERSAFVIPIAFGSENAKLASKFEALRPLGELAVAESGLWSGREMDESKLAAKLSNSGNFRFVKGRMIHRLVMLEQPTNFVREDLFAPPRSVSFERIAWRDVSRPSQKRRLIATIIPSGWIAGNSLGVAHFRDGDGHRLRSLLGIMLSYSFEYQLRSLLSTGHVSLSALRKVRVPRIDSSPVMTLLAALVERQMSTGLVVEPAIEAASAIAYGLSREYFEDLMAVFLKTPAEEVHASLEAFDRLMSGGCELRALRL